MDRRYEEGHAIGTWTYTLELGDRSVTLEEGVSTVGRSRNCTVTLGDASASRTHAEIEATDGSVKLRDLGSSNGTYVDGARVVGESPLRNGSLITIGETVMTLRFQPLGAALGPAPAEDVAATMRIEAIPRGSSPLQPPAGAPSTMAPSPAPDQPGISPVHEAPPLAAPSLRPASSPPPAAPALGGQPALADPAPAAPALGGLGTGPSLSPPSERPISRTDVFPPLGTAPQGPPAVERTMLEIPSVPAPPRPAPPRPAAASLEDMRPREAAPPPPLAPPGDMLGSIEALDHTALGGRLVRTPPPPMTRPATMPVGRPAGFWIRLGALIVDGVAIGLPLAAVNFVLTLVIPVETAAMLGGLLGMVVGLALPLVCWAVWGRTPGKALLRIGIVREGSSSPGIGFAKALVRLVGYAVSFAILGIGFLMAAFGDKRALHDRIAGTRVIRL